MKKFYLQTDQMDCGPTCIRMVAAHYGRKYSIQTLREYTEINKEGVTLLGMANAAEKIGFRTTGVKITFEQLKEAVLPCIVHWSQNHFVVVYKISRNKVFVADPGKGKMVYGINEFLEHWLSFKNNGSSVGIALLLEPGPNFYNEPDEKPKPLNFGLFFQQFFRYRKLVLQLVAGFLVASLLQLIFPFLTQSIVDVGIGTANLSFIYLILIAQFMLLLGRMSVDFIRSWILLHISTRINITVLSEFLAKLMRLPISYFDTKHTGDIMQRMGDQRRIESFLTGQTLQIVFSLFNLIIFSFVLAYYNSQIFIVFVGATILYGLWVVAFLEKRKQLDYKKFAISSKNQSEIIQLISGMQEIKLASSEKQKRWSWERIQAKLFTYNVKSLALGQYQQAGGMFINEGKNIFILFLVARLVVAGDLTLGAMLAIQYIVGQLNSPVEQFLSFIQSYQDAKISLARLNEIHELEDEEPTNRHFSTDLPAKKSIYLQNVYFKYPGAGNEEVLKNLNLTIPEGKTTAIVGMSGSGKTTILKLLLGFYTNYKGDIKIGNTSIRDFKPDFWRKNCGVVMQEGFIFSDTIANNIAVGVDRVDVQKLKQAMELANINDFINNLPLGIYTKIGAEGNGISQGQKQRLLIARAIYKDPTYLFLDEATNALDANNERVIIHNLNTHFKDKTVVVVAHRLSTVSNADKIILLDNGEITEEGTHEELTALRGNYYTLVRNQLELGN